MPGAKPPPRPAVASLTSALSPQGRGSPPAEKICAIGVSVRRWVSYHGLSLNVDLDLSPFLEVVPCGLAGKAVTSMARVLGRPVPMPEVEEAMAAAFDEVYWSA